MTGVGTFAPEARYRDANVGGCIESTIERRDDGTVVLRSPEPLRWFPDRMTEVLEQWAAEAPDRTFVARRVNGGDWRRVSYSQMLQHAKAVGQALVDRGLSVDRPIAILSGNSLEHLIMAMGAVWAGVPLVPVSPAYSLISQDYGKLRHIAETVTPGLVFADNGDYGKAIKAVFGDDVEVVLTEGSIDGRAVTPLQSLLDTVPGPSLDEAHAKVGPDTVIKFLFTSGSSEGRPGHGHQVPVHLGFHQAAEGGGEHPAHVVREPADDSSVHGVPG